MFKSIVMLVVVRADINSNIACGIVIPFIPIKKGSIPKGMHINQLTRSSIFASLGDIFASSKPMDVKNERAAKERVKID